jgi:hypothetical protein
MTQSARLQGIHAQLAGLRSQAELIVYLRHPWPRTQLLAAVLGPLPEEVALDSIRIARDKAGVGAAALRARPTPTDGTAPDGRPPAERDLALLREELDAAETIVALEGETSNTLALHAYLGALGRCDLFGRAELVSIEESEGAAGVFRFSARLAARPGYGQPNGPAPRIDSVAGSSTSAPEVMP